MAAVAVVAATAITAATITTAAVAVTAVATAAHMGAAATCHLRPWGARASPVAAMLTTDTMGHEAPCLHHHRRHQLLRPRHLEGHRCGMSGAQKAQAAESTRHPMKERAQAAAAVLLLYRPGARQVAAVAAASPIQAVAPSSGFPPLRRANQKAHHPGTVAAGTTTTIVGAAPWGARAHEVVAAPAPTLLSPWAVEATPTAFLTVGWGVASAQGTATLRGVACAGTEPLVFVYCKAGYVQETDETVSSSCMTGCCTIGHCIIGMHMYLKQQKCGRHTAAS